MSTSGRQTKRSRQFDHEVATLYDFIPYIATKTPAKRHEMARPLSESGRRIELRVKPKEKALLSRAAALRNEDLTGFILRTVMPAAAKIVEQSERLELSERDSLRVLELLENPPKPTAKLRAALKRHREIFGH